MCGVRPIDRLPVAATIEKIVATTELEKVFTIRLSSGQALDYKPGQFVMVSVYGVGEAPISISSSPAKNAQTFDLCIRSVGNLTNLLHGMKQGATIGIRGPYGNGFDMEKFKSKDIVIAAGGLGLAPLRSLIDTVLADRKSYGRLVILTGAKKPEALIYKDRLKEWDEDPTIENHVTVDSADIGWTGHVGVITTLFKYVKIDPLKTVAAIVGAPVMYKFVAYELTSRGVYESNIFLSLERRMRCGLGKCGHCQINGIYLCQDGPVITLKDAKKLKEAI